MTLVPCPSYACATYKSLFFQTRVGVVNKLCISVPSYFVNFKNTIQVFTIFFMVNWQKVLNGQAQLSVSSVIKYSPFKVSVV